jgi:hypothetical protein
LGAETSGFLVSAGLISFSFDGGRTSLEEAKEEREGEKEGEDIGGERGGVCDRRSERPR